METEEKIQKWIRDLDHPKTCDEARKALVETGAPAIPLLIAALSDKRVAIDVAGVLTEIGEAAVKPLAAALEDEKASAYAAIALEDIGLPSVGSLLQALDSKKMRVIALSVRALRNIGDERAAPGINRIYNRVIYSSQSEVLLEEIVEALRKWDYPVEKPGDVSIENFIEGLEERGFKVSPRSNSLYYHPDLPDIRFRLLKIIVKLEKNTSAGRTKQWHQERSFSVKRELHLALRIVDYMLENEHKEI